MQSGTVKWYDADRGYGFIGNDAGGNDAFLHARAVNGFEPVAGMRVEYDTRESRRRPGSEEAVNVKPLDQQEKQTEIHKAWQQHRASED